jgi:hypothetical protein
MNEQPTRHPDGSRLDALAVGAGDEEARTHIAACAACASYVDSVAKGAEAFARNEAAGAEAFVQAVRRRERAIRPRLAWSGGIASALALAAGVILFAHSRGARTDSEAVGRDDLSWQGPVRFKGGMQTATIVEHAGVQSRETGALTLEPGDRIRLEIALDHDVRIAAGVLADDGEWAWLQAPALFTGGTHYSELSITFDHDVASGWILVGTEDAVERARKSRDFHEVTTIRVRPKKP